MGKTIFIKDLTPNENIDDVFILTNIEIRQSRNGNYFMQGGIQDNSGNLGFKKGISPTWIEDSARKTRLCLRG